MIQLDLRELTQAGGLVRDGSDVFDPGDPFGNRVSAIMCPFGDDLLATVFYGGLPVLTVVAGPSRDDSHQYEWGIPMHLEPELQSVHALFFENVVGSLFGEGDERLADEGVGIYLNAGGSHTVQHAASVLVHETYDDDGITRGYDLYHDLMTADGLNVDEGHILIAFVGVIARAMYGADRVNAAAPRLPEPNGF